jgi:hypothetical protein
MLTTSQAIGSALSDIEFTLVETTSQLYSPDELNILSETRRECD